MSVNKYVTPEYLLSHGFIKYTPGNNDGDILDIPYYDEYAMHFREVDSHRQLFVVVLWTDEENGNYSHQIQVQVDYGCGFVVIPENWAQLPVAFLEAIYFGIRGEYPKQRASKTIF